MCTDIPECLTAEKVRHATKADDQLDTMTVYMIYGWPLTTAEVKE